MRLRYVFLSILFLLEVGALSFRLDTPVESTGWLRLIDNADVMANIGIVFLAAAGYQLLQLATDPAVKSYGNHPWWAWLVAHLALFALFFALGPTVLSAAPLDEFAVASWLVLGVVSVVALAFCFHRPLFLFTLVRQQSRLLLLSIVTAVAAWLLGKALQQLWKPLAEATFRITYHLLQLTHLDIQYSPDEGIIGTDRFLVQIAPQCSGYEGIGLVIVFVSLYIFIFKQDLRFPHVLVMYPVGIAAIYLANSLRLAALVLVGHFSSAEDAVRTFHSQAGWTLFTLLSLGLLAVSRTVPALNTLRRAPGEAEAPARLAFALLVPFLVLLGSAMVTSTILGERRWADPVVVVATAAALWRYRASYRTLKWSFSWQSVATGVLVFVVWMALVDGDPDRDARGTAAMLEMSGGLAAAWIVLRLIGSVLIVPVVEELAFRGYLLRKLTSRNFEAVPVDRFTWLSLIVSSALFGLLHEHWLAGTIAGVAFAFAQWQCRSLGGAVVAHGVTNGLVAAVVVLERQWSLWP